MRKAVKKVTEWTHATLILAIILPALYALGAKQPDLISRPLYVRCLLVALSVIVSDPAIERCRGLLSYLAVSALVLAAAAALGRALISSVHNHSVAGFYMTFLLIESAAVMAGRAAGRLRQKHDIDAAQNADPSWRPAIDSLRTPSFSVLIFFGAVYALALNLNNPSVCNAALFSAVLYTPAALLHKYVCATESYLALNKRTGNLPSRRIYGIGSGMLAIFLLLFILVTLPALMTVSGRTYRDIRESMTPIEFDYPEVTQELHTEAPGEDPAQALTEQFGEPGPTPAWLITLSQILEISILLLVAGALIKVICNTFHAFREAADENGDIVEELQDAEQAVKITGMPVKPRRLSERERIRKEYRKTIRRHRKDIPARHESPAEIEKNAGIDGSAEGKALHDRYELARYGRED